MQTTEHEVGRVLSVRVVKKSDLEEQGVQIALGGADIAIEIEIGNSDSDYGTVTFQLWSLDNDDDPAYDLTVRAESGDGNWGLHATRAGINLAFDEFIARGFEKMFGQITYNNPADRP